MTHIDHLIALANSNLANILSKSAFVPMTPDGPVPPDAGQPPGAQGMPPGMPPQAMGAPVDPATGMPMDPSMMGGMPQDPLAVAAAGDPNAGGMPLPPAAGAPQPVAAPPPEIKQIIADIVRQTMQEMGASGTGEKKKKLKPEDLEPRIAAIENTLQALGLYTPPPPPTSSDGAGESDASAPAPAAPAVGMGMGAGQPADASGAAGMMSPMMAGPLGPGMQQVVPPPQMTVSASDRSQVIANALMALRSNR